MRGKSALLSLFILFLFLALNLNNIFKVMT